MVYCVGDFGVQLGHGQYGQGRNLDVEEYFEKEKIFGAYSYDNVLSCWE